MNHLFSNRKKATIALALITIIAVSSLIILQTNQTTQAALINPQPLGLVGRWNFDEGSGIVASDSSGKGNTGTIHGATWVTGKYGESLYFNGVDNSAIIPNSASINPTQYITVTAWVNSNDFTRIQHVVSKRDGADGYILQSTIGQKAYAYVSINNMLVGVTGSSGKLTNNAWHFIALTYDGSYVRLYVDGIQDGVSAFISGAITSGAQSLNIGDQPGGAYPFLGIIDEIRVYNRALSAAEIQQGVQLGPDFSSNIFAKVPLGTTQVITTLSWQGTGGINVTIVSPSQTYTESMIPVYLKTTYSTHDGTSSMLNVKRLSVSVNALPSDQNWNITLTFDNSVPYQIAVEVQK